MSTYLISDTHFGHTRFSNPARVRKAIILAACPGWHELPQDLRILILEDISRAIEEVLKERT
jgi:hypothetical protein